MTDLRADARRLINYRVRQIVAKELEDLLSATQGDVSELKKLHTYAEGIGTQKRPDAAPMRRLGAAPADLFAEALAGAAVAAGQGTFKMDMPGNADLAANLALRMTRQRLGRQKSLFAEEQKT